MREKCCCIAKEKKWELAATNLGGRCLPSTAPSRFPVVSNSASKHISTSNNTHTHFCCHLKEKSTRILAAVKESTSHTISFLDLALLILWPRSVHLTHNFRIQCIGIPALREATEYRVTFLDLLFFDFI